MSAAAGGVAVSIAVVAPVVAAGGWPNMLQALGRLAHHDMLSANATNLWWVIGYLLRVRYSVHDMGRVGGGHRAGEDSRHPARHRHRLSGSAHDRHRADDRRGRVGALDGLSIATIARLRTPQSTSGCLAGVGAFLVHAYATLSAQVHENHLFAAVPLLVLASAGRRAFRPICLGVSAVVALNLNLFYGFGDGIGYALPRAITIVDLTVIVALVNCSLLSWHAAVLKRQCSTAAARRPQPAPA